MLAKKSKKDVPGHVFPRRLDKPLPVIDSAQGMWVVDTEGRRYLDASGGAVVLNVGHGREEIARAVYDQIVQCDYVHPTMFTNYPVEELATALAGHAPAGIERFFFFPAAARPWRPQLNWPAKPIWIPTDLIEVESSLAGNLTME